MHRVILHADMDAFYASVEQRDHPQYRGKPLIVGSPPDRRGVVCAASYEARAFKVRSAMPSRTAARLCPHGVFIPPRMEAYRAESARIMAILLEEAGPVLERVSVDEAYLDVSVRFEAVLEQDKALAAALPLAERIRRRIKEERGLTASVGIGPNKFLAKLASDFQKPDGLMMIPDAGKAAFLAPLPVRSIHGVGPVTAGELAERGIATIGDLQRTALNLEAIAGSFAAVLRRRAFGEDERPVDPGEERKSISAENTFESDTEDRSVLRAALREMAADVAESLAKHALGAQTVQVKVRYSDFTTLTRQVSVPDPVTGAGEIYRLCCYLLARHGLVRGPLRLLGVGVSALTPPEGAQLRLPL